MYHSFQSADGVGLLDGQEQIDLLLGQARDIDDQAVIGRVHVAQVDDVGNDRVGRAVAGPAIVGVLQHRAGEARAGADRGGNIRGELQVQHFLDEHREDDVERLLVGGGGIGGGGAAGPQPAFEVGLVLGFDLMGALDRVQRAHVERDGEQLDVHRGLRNGVKRRLVDRLVLGITARAGTGADGPWHGRSSTCCDRDFGFTRRKRRPNDTTIAASHMPGHMAQRRCHRRAYCRLFGRTIRD